MIHTLERDSIVATTVSLKSHSSRHELIRANRISSRLERNSISLADDSHGNEINARSALPPIPPPPSPPVDGGGALTSCKPFDYRCKFFGSMIK